MTEDMFTMAKQPVTRRRFLTTSAQVAGMAIGAGAVLAACSSGNQNTSGPTQITYTYPGQTPTDQEVVQTALNKLLAVAAQDQARKVFADAEQPQFQQMVGTQNKSTRLGYYLNDTPDDSISLAQFKAGKYAVIANAQLSPGWETTLKTTYGWDFVGKMIAKPIMTTSTVASALSAVARSSAHQDVCVKFLEAINTDGDVFNLLAHGIEGKHWQWANKSQKLIVPAAGRCLGQNKHEVRASSLSLLFSMLSLDTEQQRCIVHYIVIYRKVAHIVLSAGKKD